VDVFKDPITDKGKQSKKGMLKLGKVFLDGSDHYFTVSSNEQDFAQIRDTLVPVYEDGEVLLTYTFDEVRKNATL
jgi:nicotinamide phosphoribosyltransferase